MVGGDFIDFNSKGSTMEVMGTLPRRVPLIVPWSLGNCPGHISLTLNSDPGFCNGPLENAFFICVPVIMSRVYSSPGHFLLTFPNLLGECKLVC